MAKDDKSTSIFKLPNELITSILVDTEPRDIINFASTCKQFNEIVFNNDYLWKRKYTEIMPINVVKLVNEHGADWLKEMINFYKLKQAICSELLAMPAKYYWKLKPIAISDTEFFFFTVTNSNFNYYYTIHVLQEIVKEGKTLFAKNQCNKPLYTLTVVHYAKIVLRYLIHTFLAMKWFQKHLRQELTPVFVISFFLQWIDVTKIYNDEDIEQKIQWVVKQVKESLQKSFLKEHHTPPPNGHKYTDTEILNTISYILYNNNRVYETPSTKTLNLVKVIDDKTGNIISNAVLYHTVANRFDVNCELIAFPNHLFLEWKSDQESQSRSYVMNLINGEMRPKMSCPYAHGSPTSQEYCPDGLLQYIYSSYMKAKGHMKNSKTVNAAHLWDFIGTSYTTDSPYKNYFVNLISHSKSPALKTTLNLHYLHNGHMKIMLLLSRLNFSPVVGNREVVIKKHDQSVMYAVGMICYHKLYNYMCVIVGWDVVCSDLSEQNDEELQFGTDQPFYTVIAADQSERYVAQENLKLVYTPTRLYNLEDHLARDFTHFDGFVYALNDEKVVEYPDENTYIEAFKKNIPT